MLTKLAAASFLLCCVLASAAPQTDAELDTQILTAVRSQLQRSFELDAELALDADLRAEASQIAALHLVRMDGLMPGWLSEERRVQGAGGQALNARVLYFAFWARVLNELALWQIEPGDAEYERATLEVLQTSRRICSVDGELQFNDYANRIVRIQSMPRSRRGAALRTERELLSHWGRPRSSLPAWPLPLPQQEAMALVQRMQADPGRAALPLPPVLAMRVLGEQHSYADLTMDVQCALQQWWLSERLRQGAQPAEALAAFRYGTMISAAARFVHTFPASAKDGKPDAAGDGKPVFPRLAAYFGVTGSTTLRVRLDAARKPLQAFITERKVVAPGIRGVRPVVFEDVFDAASLKHALEERRYDQPGGADPAVGDFQLVWGGAQQAGAAGAGR